ncbi:unnamed protein product [Somion occarium]|uniref:EML-like second beta-propeller domain-containing protein n=1 Tax=Somion occarium TaxID=3059160 RepID=A0ABP1D4L7_9APHY
MVYAYINYAEQLAPRGYGYPMWFPDFPIHNNEILMGDVGWFDEGKFHRLFNALKPADDPLNAKFGVPTGFVPLRWDERMVDRTENFLPPGIHATSSVRHNAAEGNVQALATGQASVSITCSREQGAALFMVEKGEQQVHWSNLRHHDYIRQYHDSWFELATREGIHIRKKEDIILVRGWVKTAEWAVASFSQKGRAHEASLSAQFAPVAGGGLGYSYIHATQDSVQYRIGPDQEHRLALPYIPGSTPSKRRDQCVFLSYYKVKYRYILPRKILAEAEPGSSSDPDEDDPGASFADIETVPTPQEVFFRFALRESLLTYHDIPQFHDILDDVLNYILKRSDADMAITSQGDLNELFDGEEWPLSMASFLDIHSPRIDVTRGDRKAGFLSISDAIIRRNTANFAQPVHEVMNDPVQPQTEASTSAGTGTEAVEGGDGDETAEHHRREPAPKVVPESLQGGALVLGRNLQEGDSIEWPHRVLLESGAEGGAVCSMAVSPDGRFIAAGFEDAIVRVWLSTGDALLYKFQGHDDTVWAVAFSGDGNKLVSGSSDHRGAVWDLTTGENTFSLVGHEGDIWTVAVSPDGTKAATGSVDNKVKLWNTETGIDYATLRRHTAVVLCVAFSPDGRLVASAADADGYIWDAETGDNLATLKGHEGVIWALTFAPNGARIVTGSEDNSARVWNVENGDELVTIREHTGPIWSVSFSPDGQDVVSGSYDAAVSVCNSFTGERKHLLRERPSIVNTVAYSGDGEYITSGCADGSVKLWDASSGNFVAELQGHKDKVKNIDFTADGKDIVSSSDDGTIRIWNMVDILRLA